jgi:sulfopyruvate decarboxylase alpha subunit
VTRGTVVAGSGLAADQTAAGLVAAGYDLVAGTPCGVLKPLFARLEERVGVRYMHREDNAIAFAAGVALAGGSGLVLMQNSGLGQSINVIASLVTPFRVPVALVVSLRGTDADHTEENLGMGRATDTVLSALGLPYRRLDPSCAIESVAWLNDMARRSQRPAALLVPPGSFGWKPEE